MKLKCKLCDYTQVVEQGKEASATVLMVTHVQKRHGPKAFAAVNAIAAYMSTYFFEPIAPVLGAPSPEDADTYKETKKALLQGFRDWAKAGIVK
jgi:hypothetical protein